jgi:type I restriction enzyme S subunit
MRLSLQPVEDAPPAWARMPLHAIGNQNLEKNKGLRNDNLLSLSFGVIKKKDIDSNEGLLPESFETYQIVQTGDIIFRFTDLQNDLRSLRSAIVSEAGIITSAYLCFRPDAKKVVPNYLNYLMRAYDLAKVFYAFGGGVRQSLKYDEVRNLPIALPTHAEQEAIVDYLDRELALLDKLIEKQLQLIEVIRLRFQTFLDAHVTGRIDPSQKKNTSNEWLPEIPRQWTLARLKVALSSPVTDGPHTTPVFEAEGFPFLSVDGIQDGELVFENCRFVSESDFVEFSRKAKPEFGDILMGKAASVGKIAMVKTSEPFAIWSPLALLKIDKKHFDPSFVEFFLKSTFVQSQIQAISNANTQQNLGMNQIPNLVVVYPNLEAQRSISEVIRSELDLGQKIIGKALEVVNGIRERKIALISSAVTGRIPIEELVNG